MQIVFLGQTRERGAWLSLAIAKAAKQRAYAGGELPKIQAVLPLAGNEQP